jgi:hypothetical protein
MQNNTPGTLTKFFGHIVSFIFHPLFVPTYFILYLIKVVPFEFVGITDWQLQLRVFSVFWLTAFFPAFAVFLLWRLKFSESIFLRTQKDRIIPYVIVMFFYWWMYYLSRNFLDQPIVLKYFYFGVFIASAVGLIVNNFIKVSLHGMGMGGLLAAVVLVGLKYPISNIIWDMVVILIAGMVVSARRVVSDHSNKELTIGLGIGIITQTLAYFWVG